MVAPVVDLLRMRNWRCGRVSVLLVMLLLTGMVVVDVGVGAEGRRVVGVGLEYLSEIPQLVIF